MSNDPNDRQALSALADGELSSDEIRFLLRRVDGDHGLADDWRRIHLVRACLRRERLVLPSSGFAEAVSARIQAEAAPAGFRGWRRGAVGAIAAGLAVLALYAVFPDGGRSPQSSPLYAEIEPVGARELTVRTAAGPLQRTDGRGWTPLRTADRFDPRLEAYFLRHGGAATVAPRGGFVPYVNVVATPAASSAPRPAPVDPAARR